MPEELALEIYNKKFRELIPLPHKDFFWAKDYDSFKDVLSEENFRKAIRLKERKRARRKRCHNKLEPIVNKYIENFIKNGEYCVLVFGTCTFNDKALSLKEETRTKKVNKWLKEHFALSVANIDYGEQNGREHHHFVGLTYELVEPTKKRGKSGYLMYELKRKDYTLGFEPNLEIISNLENDKKLSNYLVKINYHSNKKTTRNRRIRYLKGN